MPNAQCPLTNVMTGRPRESGAQEPQRHCPVGRPWPASSATLPRHWPLAIGHSLVIGHWSLVIGHWTLDIGLRTGLVYRPMLYFDHNATTPVMPLARAAWLEATEKYLGNPSSPHRLRQRADTALQAPRRP